MDISACKAIADQATTNAYWIAVPKSLFFGFAAAGWVVWRLAVKVLSQKAEIERLNPHTATHCAVLSGAQSKGAI